MCSGIISGPIDRIGTKVIDKILTQKEPTLIEVKSIYINGINETIQFFIHIKKSTHKGKRFIQKINTLLGINDLIPFNKDYDIRVINNLNQQDITNEIIKYDGATKSIDLKEISGISGNVFIIEVRGPYSLDLHRIFDFSSHISPVFNDEKYRVYDIKIIIFSFLFSTRELYLTDIPLIIPFPLEFIAERLLTERQLKLFQIIESHLHERRKYDRYRKSLTQQLGFEPEDLKLAYSKFLADLENRVRNRFREFINVKSENQRSYISKCTIEFPRVGKGIPHIELHPTICFDYRNDMNKVLDIKVTIDKVKVIKIVDKIWSKIKKPKQTAPKKTLR